MPYVGGRLQDFAAPVRDAIPRVLRAVAEDAGDAMLEAAKAATPTRTGETRAAWRRLPVVRGTDELGGLTYTVAVTNTHHRALWLEYGVQPHGILPRREQALQTPDGPRGGVEHPGIRGHYMTERATDAAAVLLNTTGGVYFDALAREVYAVAALRPGIEAG